MHLRVRQTDGLCLSATSSRAHRGFALVAVLWVVMVAGLLLLGVNKMGRANLAMARNELESVRAHWLARAGVERALAELADDGRVSDGAWDYWYRNDDVFEQLELIGGVVSITAPPGPMDDPDTPRFGLTDLAGRLDLNTAKPDQLRKAGDLEAWQVASIVDWRDGDDNAEPGGAESPYYQALPYPYEIRNGPFQTMDELRLVQGLDGPTLVGEDVNGNGILDANENDFARTWPDDDGDGELRPGLTSLVTIYAYELNRDADGQERVNVNSCDSQTLMDRFQFTQALADGLTGHQSGSSGGPSNGSSEGSSGGPSEGSSGDRSGDRSSSGGSRFNSLMDLLDVKPKEPDSDAPQGGENDENAVKEITLTWLADHLDELTLTDDRRLPARVNVNTASPVVLSTLPELNDSTVDAIVRRQNAGAGPFTSVGELLTSETLTESQFKAVAEVVTVRSNVFAVRSTGLTRWGIRHTIVAVVDRGTTPMSILYWYQSE